MNKYERLKLLRKRYAVSKALRYKAVEEAKKAVDHRRHSFPVFGCLKCIEESEPEPEFEGDHTRGFRPRRMDWDTMKGGRPRGS